MAKSKVINTVLNLRDNMSGGLLKAARNAKKAGADIDESCQKHKGHLQRDGQGHPAGGGVQE